MRFLVRDRDTKFTATFDNIFASIGAETILTSVRSPRANAFAERWVRTVREDCLDHVLVFSRRHLEMILGEYVARDNQGRPHRGRDLTPPRPTRAASSAGTVRRRDLNRRAHPRVRAGCLIIPLSRVLGCDPASPDAPQLG